ncbi:hypothetical protein [Parachitinimonas caeni]|uniref:DUF3558 domain-containing protein n=1 Tax=Parachitinimonas caeni TaxID=3031301 RepID=A0ABT7DV42_9NEIS|nr:hypothetical protein [Parachitinimonas caeni]MDK2123911.1 hypothetical protein [Parachitinimonas caeni]
MNAASFKRRAGGLIVAGLALVAALPAQAEIAPGRLQACPLSPAEIKAALGLEVRAGTPTDITVGAGNKLLGCDYVAVNGNQHVNLGQFWAQAKDVPMAAASMGRQGVGMSVEHLRGDPDHAIVSMRAEQDGYIKLEYMRENVLTTISVVGSVKTDEIKPRLLKLKRIPE